MKKIKRFSSINEDMKNPYIVTLDIPHEMIDKINKELLDVYDVKDDEKSKEVFKAFIMDSISESRISLDSWINSNDIIIEDIVW